MDCSPTGSSIHGIFQARVLEWGVIAFSRGSSQCRDQSCVFFTGRQIVYPWATREILRIWLNVQLSHSVMSDSLQAHGLQHTRLPCPSPIPGAYSNSCPLSRWCHPTISSSVIPFSSHFLASGSFLRSQFFASSGQSIGALASASVLPMNIQDWFPLGLTSLISLLSKRLSRVLQHHNSKTSILWCSAFFLAQLSHPYYGKNHSFD